MIFGRKVYLCSVTFERKMYRACIKELTQWKLDKNRKPLIFLGARQTGKTWLLQEFGRTEYR